MKLNTYLVWAIIITVMFLVTMGVIGFFLNPYISYEGALNGTNLIYGNTHALKFETIPTVINGITAVTSIIIGFSGAIIGLVYREDFRKDQKTKISLLGLAFYSVVPLTFLLVVYNSLVYGALDFALKYAFYALILALLDFIIAMLSVFYKLSLQKCTESGKGDSDKPEQGKQEEPKSNQKPTDASLIAEYEALNGSVDRRSSEMIVADSFLFPISLAIVTFSIIYRKELGMNYIFSNVPNAIFLPILSAILVFVFYYFWLTTAKINDMCFTRLHEIEKELRIEGHSSIKKWLENRGWWKIRKHLWHFIFLLLIGAYLFTAYWLFRELLPVNPPTSP